MSPLSTFINLMLRYRFKQGFSFSSVLLAVEEVEKGCIGNKWVKTISTSDEKLQYLKKYVLLSWYNGQSWDMVKVLLSSSNLSKFQNLHTM